LPSDIELLIDKQGRIVFIHDDDLALALAELGIPITTRASHVEPSMAHPGKWIADMSPTVGDDLVLGPFDTRREALTAEVKFLRRWLES
jgi:hypothetical protein